MKIKSNITILIILALISCGNNQSSIKSDVEQKEEKTNKLTNNKRSSNPGEYFSESVLGRNVGIKSVTSSELNSQKYNQLFSQKGVLNIVTYYDKRSNHLNQPEKFKEFLLFEVNYDNSENAKKAFERIKSDAEISNSNEKIELRDRTRFLNLGENFGGLITYNKNQVFSLVENCENSPLNKSWLELEYILTDLLENKSGYVEVLKAGCNEGKYYGGRRKASS